MITEARKRTGATMTHGKKTEDNKEAPVRKCEGFGVVLRSGALIRWTIRDLATTSKDFFCMVENLSPAQFEMRGYRIRLIRMEYRD